MGEILFLLGIGLAIFVSIVAQIVEADSEPQRKKDDYLLLPIKNFGPGPPFYCLPIEREAVEGKSDDEEEF
jgi:hypothetical protein